ncbi:MAG TPA: xanthine dehydrogenase family protein subunit M [bacterium]|nr:xanthine dehydrogenase family protein subunit M [bacterium]
MLEFDYIAARDLGEALDALSRGGAEAAVLAGGTDLHVLVRSGARKPKLVVAIGRIPALRSVAEAEGEVRLGAALTHAELARDPRLQKLRALTQAASAVGSPQVRNVGTVGGNLANASPAGDSYPPLLAFDARVVVASARATRELALEGFATGPGETVLAPGELITEVTVSPPRERFYSGFAKVGLRNAVAISVANCALVATMSDGRLGDVRLASGALAPRAIRMRQTEALLRGQRLTSELVEQASQAAAAECSPITDIRASAAYRRHVAGVLVARLLREAWRDLAGADPGGA